METRRALVSFCAGVVLLWGARSQAQDEPKLTIGGATYTKFLFGTDRDQGSLYNFTSVPGEGYGDNGEGTELELLIDARLSRQVEVKARLHSRFSQNFWTNYGGFGGDPTANCTAGDCGEFDPRSDQYVKLRGVAVTLTPGYTWVDSINIGANDWGQFDPFVVGRIRYIDRDNSAGVLFQGSAMSKRLTWDAAVIALPRLWAGPNYSTGEWHASDASLVAQMKYRTSSLWDLSGIFNFTNDQELNPTQVDIDRGRQLTWRARNIVAGLKGGVHFSPTVDLRGQYYYSYINSNPNFAPANFAVPFGFGPVITGKHGNIFNPGGQTDLWQSGSGKLNLDINDPFGVGLSLLVEGFSIGADYTSIMAARRESDVLLTEGHDGSFALPGPNNASFGVYKGNPTRIGYGGWDGNAQQVATLNVDNEFTDFDEPMAETVIGWKGITFAPTFNRGPLDISGEYSYISYNTNWQAWGDPSQPVTTSDYPTMEGDTGVGHNFRSAFAPFQDKVTHILVARVKYVLERVGSGLELFGKVKYIYEHDNRLNDPRFLPYIQGTCPGNGGPCADTPNYYSPGNTTAGLYGNPGVVTVNGQTGYQWKPFDNIADDDRDLRYSMFNLGMGYQLTDDLYGAITYSHFHADLRDGDTAFQAYGGMEMASGHHDKNQLSVRFKYVLAGVEIGAEGQQNWGTFIPDFGTGFVPQVADATISKDHGVPVGSLGFTGRSGGWNSLDVRNFAQTRAKAYLKVMF